MAKHGVLHETDAQFISQCINRGAMTTFDVDGGAPIVLGGVNATEKELYDGAKFTTGKKQVAIAFNPSVKYDVVGDLKIPAVSLDDRNYTNLAGVVDVFIPEKNVEFGIQKANIDGSTKPTVGKFLEPKNGTLLYEIKATQTEGVPSFEVVDIIKVKYPTATFTEDVEEVYVVATRFNG